MEPFCPVLSATHGNYFAGGQLVAYNAPITGAPLPWLVTDSASSLQAGLGDEVADTAAEVVIDANAVQLVLGNELVNPGAGNTEHLGG